MMSWYRVANQIPPMAPGSIRRTSEMASAPHTSRIAYGPLTSRIAYFPLTIRIARVPRRSGLISGPSPVIRLSISILFLRFSNSFRIPLALYSIATTR